MEIKKIEFNPKTNKWYLVVVPDQSRVELSENTIVHFELMQGKKITTEIYQDIIKYDALQEYYSHALRFLNRRRTAYEVFEFLTKKNDVPKEDAETIVKTLELQKYLNDFEYAKALLHDQIHFQKKSFYAVMLSLNKKGINDTNILEEIQCWYGDNVPLQNIELENLQGLINQLEKTNKKYNNYERNQRIIAKLSQKGYNRDTIKQLLSTKTTTIMNEDEKRKLLEKHRARVFQAKNSYQYIAYMKKYDIPTDDLISFFNSERMNHND